MRYSVSFFGLWALSLVCVFVYVFIRAPAIPPGTMSVREHRVAKPMK